MKRSFLNLSLGIVILSGCSHLNLDREEKEKLVEKPHPWSQHQKWWAAFHDPLLNQLADQVLKENLDLQIALTRLREANVLKSVAQAAFFPHVSGQASVLRGNATIPQVVTRKQAGLSADWEIDVFGRVRASVDRAEANELSKRAGVEEARRLIIADLAEAVIEWRQAKATLKALKRLKGVQGEQVNLLSKRVKAGLIDASFWERSHALKEQTKATIYPVKALENAALYRIEQLMNCRDSTIRDLLKAHSFLLIKIPEPDSLETISVETLAHRPDIKIAQADLLGAHADCRQAEASLWPQISLSAFFGVQNPSNTFFLSKNPIWSMGSSLVLPLLNFGQLRGALRAADARAQEALLYYEKTINAALQETKTSLSDYLNGANAINNQVKAFKNRKNAVKIATLRFSQGLTDKTDLTTSEVELYQSQLNLISVTTDAALAYIHLQKALGLSENPSASSKG
jgi:NodT family efflux transporter outer membrane factor (OMF) lipoprotein